MVSGIELVWACVGCYVRRGACRCRKRWWLRMSALACMACMDWPVTFLIGSELSAMCHFRQEYDVMRCKQDMVSVSKAGLNHWTVI